MTNTDYDSLFKFLGYKTKSAKQESNSETEFYFRGHPDSAYLLAPAIFREDKLTENEVYHEIFRNHADEFRGMKPIDVLAKMQHYGVPTRLLDVTANLPVAAFFSVSNLGKDKPKGESPEILTFVAEKENIKNYDSDTVKLLSHLPLLKEEERIKLRIDALNSILILGFIEYFTNTELTNNWSFKEMSSKKYISISEELIHFVENYQSTSKEAQEDIPEGCTRYLIIKRNEIVQKELNVGSLNIYFSKVEFKVNQLTKNKQTDNGKNSSDIDDTDETYTSEMTEEKTEISFNHNRVLNITKEKGNTVENLYKECLNAYIDMDDELKYHPEIVKTITADRLYFQIQQNYPVFYECARPLDLLNGVFVTPIVNTNRMRAQQGAFMLFGLSRYWDVLKCMEFLDKEKFTYKDIMQFIIEDKPLDDKTNLFYQHYKALPENEYREKVREFEDYIFGITRYSLDGTKKADVLRKLDEMGINKQTLGCGMDTTYYNMLCKKDKIEPCYPEGWGDLFGSITDSTFCRPEQPELETREAL